MIEQGLFKRHFVGRDGFIWWIGQVVSEEKWSGNLPGYRTRTTGDHRGFGERFKVRIMGYHTANKQELTDDQLPWASVMYPVTAGNGGAGTWSNAALRQGSFVFGFFLDGEDAQQPVIMGVIGFNEYTALSNRDNSDVAFFPFSGYTLNDTVARYSLTTTKETPKGTQVNSKSPASNNGVQESVAGHEKKTGADKEQYDEGRKKNPVASPSTCEAVPLGKIQIEIKNMIAEVEKIKKTANNWEAKVSKKINNIEKDINLAVAKASKFVAESVKWLINEVQKFTTNKINNTLKDTYYLLFPNQRPGLKKAVETANDLIACLFRKIISNLLKMVGNFLLQAVDRFINTPLCAVENFVGALIGKLSGLITSAVDAILGPVRAIVGTAFSIAGDILNFITDLLSFLSCEEKPSCGEVKEWSIWDGADSPPTLDLNSIISKVESIASTVTQAIDPNNFDFDLDFTDVFDALGSCNVGAVFCGPPKVEFFGGGGSGATGNAIISSVGDILGVDIITPGSGYTSAPFVRFVDECGNGSGASGRAILGQVPIVTTAGDTTGQTQTTGDTTGQTQTTGDTTGQTQTTGDTTGQTQTTGDTTGQTQTTGVVRVVMEESGTGYLPSPNGSQGGDGRTWATADQTTVRNNDGTYDTPYSPGQTFSVDTGDQVYFNGTTTVIDQPQTLTASPLSQVTLPEGAEISPLSQVTLPVSQVTLPEGAEISPLSQVTLPEGAEISPLSQVTLPEGAEISPLLQVTLPEGAEISPLLQVTLPRGVEPTLNNGQYPIILEIGDVFISNPGFSYNPNDRIVISPDNGAVMKPEFDSLGSLTKVNLISSGEGFTEFPDIYIESDTGYNAKITPIFDVRRVDEEQIQVPESQIINVIDCVGKF